MIGYTNLKCPSCIYLMGILFMTKRNKPLQKIVTQFLFIKIFFEKVEIPYHFVFYSFIKNTHIKRVKIYV